MTWDLCSQPNNQATPQHFNPTTPHSMLYSLRGDITLMKAKWHGYIKCILENGLYSVR